MSEEDAVPLDRRSICVEDSGGRVKRQAGNLLTVKEGVSAQTRQIRDKNDKNMLE
jgi:hypothetical protein